MQPSQGGPCLPGSLGVGGPGRVGGRVPRGLALGRGLEKNGVAGHASGEPTKKSSHMEGPREEGECTGQGISIEVYLFLPLQHSLINSP